MYSRGMRRQNYWLSLTGLVEAWFIFDYCFYGTARLGARAQQDALGRRRWTKPIRAPTWSALSHFWRSPAVPTPASPDRASAAARERRGGVDRRPARAPVRIPPRAAAARRVPLLYRRRRVERRGAASRSREPATAFLRPCRPVAARGHGPLHLIAIHAAHHRRGALVSLRRRNGATPAS